MKNLSFTLLLAGLMGFSSCAQNQTKEYKPMENTATAIYASGCFWGTEYYMKRAKGVLATTVGYTGGHVDHPSYKQVCTGTTGHFEAILVEYNPAEISYEELTKLFFETHDPTQANGQGPDIGPQYRSALFYQSEEEKATAEALIATLKSKGYDVVTFVLPRATFWAAEDYHQDYYDNKGGTPYCHAYKKKF